VLRLGEHAVEEGLRLVLGALLGEGDLTDEDVPSLGEHALLTSGEATLALATPQVTDNLGDLDYIAGGEFLKICLVTARPVGWLLNIGLTKDLENILETLVINVAGCLAIGFLAVLSETRGIFDPSARGFLFVGLLGGFTTFSTFGYETFHLFREGQLAAGLTSIALQIVLGLGAVWGGAALARLVGGS